MELPYHGGHGKGAFPAASNRSDSRVMTDRRTTAIRHSFRPLSGHRRAASLWPTEASQMLLQGFVQEVPAERNTGCGDEIGVLKTGNMSDHQLRAHT